MHLQNIKKVIYYYTHGKCAYGGYNGLFSINSKVNSLLKFGIKPGLERIGELLNRLGNPQDKLKFVHVAGTNGKGTACTLISNVLTAAGYKTGLYTSPYIMDFRERFRINGEMIPKDELSKLTERVSKIVDEMKQEDLIITEFEFITALAFCGILSRNVI